MAWGLPLTTSLIDQEKLSGIQPSTTNGISQKLYPLVICYIAIENTTFIVDLPIENGGIFP